MRLLSHPANMSTPKQFTVEQEKKAEALAEKLKSAATGLRTLMAEISANVKWNEPASMQRFIDKMENKNGKDT